jgi:hypothetical protein
VVLIARRKKFKWAARLEKLGGMLVVIGVAGELYVETVSSPIQERLRMVSAGIIEGSRKQAADANAKAESAKTLARGYDRQIADAGREAAQARSEAAASDLARVRLEAQIQPRTLMLAQQKDCADKWRKFSSRAGLAVVVRSYALDIEAKLLGAQILEALGRGGLKPIDQRSQYTPGIDAETGIVVRGPSEQQDFIAAIVGALTNEAHLGAISDSKPFPGGVLILIGIKPLPLLPKE